MDEHITASLVRVREFGAGDPDAAHQGMRPIGMTYRPRV